MKKCNKCGKTTDNDKAAVCECGGMLETEPATVDKATDGHSPTTTRTIPPINKHTGNLDDH